MKQESIGTRVLAMGYSLFSAVMNGRGSLVQSIEIDTKLSIVSLYSVVVVMPGWRIDVVHNGIFALNIKLECQFLIKHQGMELRLDQKYIIPACWF
jgi:hypothetical protein